MPAAPCRSPSPPGGQRQGGGGAGHGPAAHKGVVRHGLRQVDARVARQQRGAARVQQAQRAGHLAEGRQQERRRQEGRTEGLRRGRARQGRGRQGVGRWGGQRGGSWLAVQGGRSRWLGRRVRGGPGGQGQRGPVNTASQDVARLLRTPSGAACGAAVTASGDTEQSLPRVWCVGCAFATAPAAAGAAHWQAGRATAGRLPWGPAASASLPPARLAAAHSRAVRTAPRSAPRWGGSRLRCGRLARWAGGPTAASRDRAIHLRRCRCLRPSPSAARDTAGRCLAEP